ncbi:MAG: preprotein translocase subunit SecE [Oscillospiraceae bacterium]|nr:preprotein translocase subunit SecE [Oscillospiraceae bacterium]
MAKNKDALKTKKDKKAAGDSAKKKKTGAKKPNRVVKYFKDLKSEFKKVVWPSKKTVFNNTGVVLVTMVISGLFIWGIDSLFVKLLELLINQAG